MIENDILCKKCEHYNICRYQQDMIEFFEKNGNKLIENKIDLPIVFTYKCKWFKSADNYFFKEHSGVKLLSASKDSCEGCQYYDPTGTLYIGDSPCQLCSKSPYRLTCKAKTI